MHIGEKAEVALLHRDLVEVIEPEHLTAGEAVKHRRQRMLSAESWDPVLARESLHKRREDAVLDELVVQHLCFGGLLALIRNGRVAVAKLATNGAVLQRDGSL